MPPSSQPSPLPPVDAGDEIAVVAGTIAALSATTELLPLVLESLTDAVLVVDATGQCVLWNPAAATIFNTNPADLPSATWQQHLGILDPATALPRDPTAFPLARALAGELVAPTLLTCQRAPTERPRWLTLAATPIRDPAGRALGAVLVLREVTKALRQEAALQDAQHRFEALIRSSSDAVVLTDGSGRIRVWNAGAERTFGYTAPEIEGQLFEELLTLPELDQLNEGGEGCLQLVGIRNTGEHFPCEMSFALQTADPAAYQTFILRDVSQREALKAQLLQAQKLEAIGQLAAGVAHEINTPTQYVSDNTHFLKQELPALLELLDASAALCAAAEQDALDPAQVATLSAALNAADLAYLRAEIPVAIEQSLQGLERIAIIVRSMKALAHPGGTVEKSHTDLNELIRNTIVLATNEWRYVAEVQTTLDPDLPALYCLPGAISQVILNLIVNAAHAIAAVPREPGAPKGQITITTRTLPDAIELTIGDTGCGIPAEIRAKVLHPFFTTKEVGKGTGQGLAIAHSIIVNQHQGSLSFDSTVDVGTTFTIVLPLRREEGDLA